MSGDRPDVIVVGGGLVGAATAYGLARGGRRVTILDEGDTAIRASRGNFALVWVQSKGLGNPDYARWTRHSAKIWPELADALQGETGIDLALQQEGGFTLCLSEGELARRVAFMQELTAQSPDEDFSYEVLGHNETRRHLPAIGPEVTGAIFSLRDGHVNALRLFRALHQALAARGVRYLPMHPVVEIRPGPDGFTLAGPWGEVTAPKVVLAAGLANARLAPMVGLVAPLTPNRGQILVTEKLAPFLPVPLVNMRQADEGGVMIGDSQEDAGFDISVRMPVLASIAQRACRMFPVLRQASIVRSWAALRVMSPDGYPIYDRSEVHPGASLVTCHSGVTLAAAHALTLAPMLMGADPLPANLSRFSGRRFDVPLFA